MKAGRPTVASRPAVEAVDTTDHPTEEKTAVPTKTITEPTLADKIDAVMPRTVAARVAVARLRAAAPRPPRSFGTADAVAEVAAAAVAGTDWPADLADRLAEARAADERHASTLNVIALAQAAVLADQAHAQAEETDAGLAAVRAEIGDVVERAADLFRGPLADVVDAEGAVQAGVTEPWRALLALNGRYWTARRAQVDVARFAFLPHDVSTDGSKLVAVSDGRRDLIQLVESHGHVMPRVAHRAIGRNAPVPANHDPKPWPWADPEDLLGSLRHVVSGPETWWCPSIGELQEAAHVLAQEVADADAADREATRVRDLQDVGEEYRPWPRPTGTTNTRKVDA